MAESQLLSRTKALMRVRSRTLTYKQIANATKISERWLGGLMSGFVKHPDVERIERLYVFLTGKPFTFS